MEQQQTTYGKGKGGKGYMGKGYTGKSGLGKPKRYQQASKTEGLSRPSVRRLSRRAGIKRINGYLYEEVNGVAAKYIENLLEYALQYTYSARRNTVSPSDIVHAAKRSGFPIYGF